ncbi:MAG: hypothetical protein IKA77_03760 [Clostridia bacterium]|nr:hypothetical protein [Clostridia bacterium]
MQTLENLYSRRTIRSYNGVNLTKDELNEILKSAYAAPIGLKRYDSLALTVITNADYIARWEHEVLSRPAENILFTEHLLSY